MAGLEFGVTAKKKLLGLFSDTGKKRAGISQYVTSYCHLVYLDALDVMNVVQALAFEWIRRSRASSASGSPSSKYNFFIIHLTSHVLY